MAAPAGLLSLPLWAVLLIPAAPLLLGWLAGDVISSAVQLRSLRRTGHVLHCPGARGWPCPCQESP